MEGPEERQSGIATVMAGPVADAIMPATASSSTVLQLERTTAQPDEEEISALIKLAQGFLSNRDFSSVRLLLRRAAEAGSAAAALSLGETFDPFVIQQLHAIAAGCRGRLPVRKPLRGAQAAQSRVSEP
jgi:hypothetical protein